MKRGIALASTLFVVFMVLLLGLTLATLASYQYQSAHGLADRRMAFEAAQAGLSRAVYMLSANPTYGLANETLSSTIGSSSYTVTFNAGSGLPWSKNNFQSPSSTAGYKSLPVPPYCAHIVAQGTSPCRQTKIVEMLVQRQSYTYALASDNGISIGGLLSVNGSTSLLGYQGGSTSESGNVYSGTTVTCSGALPGAITGKVRVVGSSVTLSPGTVVADGIETQVTPESLPDIDIASYSNQNYAGVTHLAAGSYLLPMVITGPTYVPGNLTLNAGATLINATLYVQGNLSGSLAITGTGTIFVTGTASLPATVTLDATSSIAVFCQQSLTMHGTGFFQGVLYSHGPINASGNLVVVGAVIAQGGGASISVTNGGNLLVTYIPELASFASNFVSHGTGTLTQLFWREGL